MPTSRYLCVVFFIAIVSFSRVVASEEVTQSSGEILSLNDCITIISEKNDDLSFAKAEIEVQSEKYSISQKERYPSLATSYKMVEQTPSTYVNRNNFSYNVSVEQPVYKGGAIVTAIDIGKLSLEGAEQSYLATKSNLLLTIYKTYYNLLESQKIEIEAAQAVKRLEAHLKDANNFYKVGMIPMNELLTSEVELAQGLQDQLVAQNKTSLAKAQLNVMMKRPADSDLAVVDIPSPDAYDIVWQDILDKALAARPELAKNKIDSKISERNIQLSKVKYLPTVTVSANYGKTGDDFAANSYSLGPSENKSVQTLATWNFVSWGKKDSSVAAATKEFFKSKRSIEALRDKIILEAREAYLNFTYSIKNIEVSKKAVQQAEENFRINQARFRTQRATTTEVLDAQALLSKANTNYYKSVYAVGLSLVTIDWATGALAGRQ